MARFTAADWILVAAALFMVGRSIVEPRPSINIMGALEVSGPVSDDHWDRAVATGIRFGDPTSTDTIVEFIDFECPFCRLFVSRLDSLLASEPFDKSVLVVFQHYPLTNHRFSVPAAIAAECGDRQGQFEAIYRLLLAKQDSLGLKTWRAYASDARVPNLDTFERCRQLPLDSFPRITAGQGLGRDAGVTSTPTIWFRRVSHRGMQALDSIANRILALQHR